MTGSDRRGAAVVTGGAAGIGRAVGDVLAQQGFTVVVADLDEDAAREAAATIAAAVPGGAAVGVRCDVAAEDDVEALAARAVEAGGTLDVWVNNAGITRDKTLRNMTLADFRAVLDVHLVGAWLGTRAAAARMREQGGGGAIVNLSSISGKVGNIGQTNYSAAKAGMVGLTKASAKELARYGIRVNAVQPGIIRTAMTAAMKPEILAAREAEVPLGRIGEPSEIAEVIGFLVSPASSYMTGTVLEITGGRHM